MPGEGKKELDTKLHENVYLCKVRAGWDAKVKGHLLAFFWRLLVSEEKLFCIIDVD